MNRFWAILLAVAAVAFTVSPFLVPDFDGFEPTQFPEVILDPPVQPAGYAFSIWGLIYLWLLIGAWFGAFARTNDLDWAAMRPPLTVSLAVGATWLPVASVSPIAATVLIWVMLAGALRAHFCVGDTDRWLQQAPVAIYAGWLTAASSVALGIVIGGYGWLDPTPAALVALAIGLAIAVVAQYQLHRAPEYGITVIWALIAVIVANSSPFNAAVSGVAILGIIVILSLRGTDTE